MENFTAVFKSGLKFHPRVKLRATTKINDMQAKLYVQNKNVAKHYVLLGILPNFLNSYENKYSKCILQENQV